MKLVSDINEWIKFCGELVYEMRDYKSSDYKQGMAEGVEMAVAMLTEYLQDYPEFNDPKK